MNARVQAVVSNTFREDMLTCIHAGHTSMVKSKQEMFYSGPEWVNTWRRQ